MMMNRSITVPPLTRFSSWTSIRDPGFSPSAVANAFAGVVCDGGCAARAIPTSTSSNVIVLLSIAVWITFLRIDVSPFPSFLFQVRGRLPLIQKGYQVSGVEFATVVTWVNNMRNFREQYTSFPFLRSVSGLTGEKDTIFADTKISSRVRLPRQRRLA